MPAEVAAAEQALLRLEIEHRALAAELGASAQHRRQWLDAELARARAETGDLRAGWEAQKEMVARTRELIRTEETLRGEEDQARN